MEQGGEKGLRLLLTGVFCQLLCGGTLLLLLAGAIAGGILPWRFSRIAVCGVWGLGAFLWGAAGNAAADKSAWFLRLVPGAAVLLLAFLLGELCLGGAALQAGGFHFALSVLVGTVLGVLAGEGRRKRRRKQLRRKR